MTNTAKGLLVWAGLSVGVTACVMSMVPDRTPEEKARFARMDEIEKKGKLSKADCDELTRLGASSDNYAFQCLPFGTPYTRENREMIDAAKGFARSRQ